MYTGFVGMSCRPLDDIGPLALCRSVVSMRWRPKGEDYSHKTGGGSGLCGASLVSIDRRPRWQLGPCFRMLS